MYLSSIIILRMIVKSFPLIHWTKAAVILPFDGFAQLCESLRGNGFTKFSKESRETCINSCQGLTEWSTVIWTSKGSTIVCNGNAWWCRDLFQPQGIAESIVESLGRHSCSRFSQLDGGSFFSSFSIFLLLLIYLKNYIKQCCLYTILRSFPCFSVVII